MYKHIEIQDCLQLRRLGILLFLPEGSGLFLGNFCI